MPGFSNVLAERLDRSIGARWLFAVPDGDPNSTGAPVMLSVGGIDAYNRGVIRLARIDPLDAASITSPPAFTDLVPAEEMDIRDHWHLWVDGRHVISYCSDHYLYLAATDADPASAASPQYAPFPIVGPGFAAKLPPPALAVAWPVNVHCMVQARGGGVRVVLSDRTFERLRFVHCSSALTVLDTVLSAPRLTGAGEPMKATASARRLGTGREGAQIVLLSPTALEWDEPSDLVIYDAEPTFSACAELARIAGGDGDQVQMGTVVFLPGGYKVVTYKRLEVGWRTDASQNDGGSICRQLYDAAWAPVGAEEVLLAVTSATPAQCGNRPHTARYEEAGTTYLITTWDEWDCSSGRGTTDATPLGCHYRVDAWVP